MKKLILILTAVLLCLTAEGQAVWRVHQGEKIGDAIGKARWAYWRSGESSIILIDPGTYYEELTIDVPNLTLRNASPTPSLAMKNGGVDVDENAVRISWYCGHGYQYKSMGERFNYGGKRERRWNASVLVTAPGFTAENIIFENSFNLYVSPAEVQDSLVDISRAEELCGQDMSSYWSEKEKPAREMPQRPKTAYSTEVQQRLYRERASALSFTSEAKYCRLHKCRVVGRQDSFYGDHGAEIYADSCVLCGAVDYIFGGMTLVAYKCNLVGMCGPEKGDRCYIAAGRGAPKGRIEWLKHPTEHSVIMPQWCSEETLDSIPEDEMVWHGMLFEECYVRHATADELVNPGREPIYLARPWRWWGEMVFECTWTNPSVLSEERFSLGLTKGHPVLCCDAWHTIVRGETESINYVSEPRCLLPEKDKLQSFFEWLGWAE